MEAPWCICIIDTFSVEYELNQITIGGITITIYTHDIGEGGIRVYPKIYILYSMGYKPDNNRFVIQLLWKVGREGPCMNEKKS